MTCELGVRPGVGEGRGVGLHYGILNCTLLRPQFFVGVVQIF